MRIQRVLIGCFFILVLSAGMIIYTFTHDDDGGSADPTANSSGQPSVASSSKVSPSSSVQTTDGSVSTTAVPQSPTTPLVVPEFPDSQQLLDKISQLMAAYFSILPSDFDKAGKDNGNRKARVAALVPADQLYLFGDLSVSTLEGLNPYFTTNKGELRAEARVDELDVFAEKLDGTTLNILVPVTITAYKPTAKGQEPVLSFSHTCATNWRYQGGVWTLTHFTR